jgi:ureidoacrylate peracid hydrolase
VSIVEILRERLAPWRCVLIVVDMQNDFCHPDGSVHRTYGLDITAGQAILPTLHQLSVAARAAGVPVFYTLMSNDATTESRAFLGRRLVGPRSQVCRTGSWGADLWGVEPSPEDVRLVKHRHSAFHGTDLDLRLRSLGRDVVVLTGVNTNVCVESTARDACALDYWTVVVGDATAAYTAEEHRAGLHNVATYFGAVVSSDDVLAAWQT